MDGGKKAEKIQFKHQVMASMTTLHHLGLADTPQLPHSVLRHPFQSTPIAELAKSKWNMFFYGDNFPLVEKRQNPSIKSAVN